MGENKKIIVVTGPTATGKTALAVDLALFYHTEIISCDSMQVYKYMDIGTAKPTLEERRGVVHHLMDRVYPDDSYNVARFKDDAQGIIELLHNRGKIPILCGGTGLYIDSLIRNIVFLNEDDDDSIREELYEIAKTQGSAHLHSLLEKADRQQASKIHPNNVKRVVRALEVFIKTGLKPSERNKRSLQEKSPYDFHIIGLNLNRDTLYKRINSRVDEMISKGLTDEVRGLIDLGYGPGLNSMQGLGYKEMVPYLYGRETLKNATDILKRNTRRFAKRQLTWFRKNGAIKWYYPDEYPSADSLFKNIVANLQLF